MQALQSVLTQIDGWVWSPVLVALLFGTGLYLTIGLKFMTIYRLPAALGMMFKKSKPEDEGDGEISPLAALFTALSATIGTGNIAGVATASVTTTVPVTRPIPRLDWREPSGVF